jgi:hypothetical protein
MATGYYQDDEPFDIFGSDPLGRNYIYGLSGSGDGLGLQPPAQGLQLDPRPYDQMQATPRSFISGLFSDVLGGALNMPDLPKTGVPALDLFYANRRPMMNLLGVGDVQKTAERISYGEPLTTGSGMTLRPRDETIGAALTVAPFVGEAASLGSRFGRAGARMVGERMAENVAMGRPNLPNMFAEPRSSLFAVEPSPMAAPKPQAPVSELGFYSAAEQAALNLPRNKGTGQSFLNDLMKSPDVKKDELAWIGLDDFLKDKPNVTKQEVQDFIASNKIDLQEVTMGAPLAEDPIGIANRKAIFDKYEPEIQALYKEMDSPSYVLINRQVSPEEYQRGVVLQNRVYRGEPITAQEQADLESILNRNQGNVVQEFRNDEEARKFYLGMNPEERLRHSIKPKTSSTELQKQINILQRTRDIEADKAYVIPEPKPTKYSKYQLAGGENYREILLKIPENMSEYNKYTDSLRAKYGQGGFANLPLTDIERARLEKFYASEDVRPYQSSHFNDPNILAHIRVNDRIDADGKKMLLVEELQSDWHQAGREKGYKGQFKDLPNDYKVQSKTDKDGYAYYEVLDPQGNVFAKDYSKGSVTNQAINRLNETVGGVPDAPFKDTWYQLALKRVMKYAADNGYERVGLTTGKQQAKRYDLGNEVNSIDVESVEGVPNLQLVDIDVIGGQKIALEVENGVVREGEFAGKRLSDVVGKEMADKITNVAQGKTKSLAGEDLRLGGEGMKKYYDEIYPKFLEKYGKKWDASVGETKVNTVKERAENSMIPIMGQEPVRYIDITPKMKESVGKGQPLFTAIPAGTLGLGGLEYADPFASPLTEDTTR